MKKTILSIIAFMTLCSAPSAAQTTPQWPTVTTEMKPGARWWWMGSAVDEANLKWNIGQYADAGIGTLEITPIYGVKGNEGRNISYLSKAWMQALKTCQTTGDERNMDIDMNGGTGWPFGGPWLRTEQTAGKLVTKNETKTADGTQVLTLDVRSPEAYATLNKVMAYQQDGNEVADVTEFVDGTTLKWKAPAGTWLLLAIFNGHTGQDVKRAAPGGAGKVLDHYDADAVAAYLNYFDKAFAVDNSRWPHTFFNDSYEVYGADWTPKMFSEFEKYRGYKLEENMDKLLGLGNRKDTNQQVLADYRMTLSDMLLNNFTRQWTQWAHSHGVTTRNQSHGSPGNIIDFYAAVDIPEIEGFGITDFKIKGLRTDPGFTSANLSDMATLKYASSAAHVTGKPLVSSETFTWLAEHFRVSLSQMKPEVDLMFLSGVNHIFFHGTTYSPQTAAWPGWKFYASIDMSPTNSIWRDAPQFMDYATRCQSFLQMGQSDNDLLVYAPCVDAMHKNTGANAARLQLFDINTLSQKIPSMVTAVKNIEQAGLDCDFISDELLLGTTVENGMIVTAAGTRYRGIVVPVVKNMPETVKAHVEALEQAGAKVVWDNNAASLSSFGAPAEEMRTKLGLRTLRRKNATGYHYFITNLSPNDISGMTSLAVSFTDAALFNPMTGEVSKAYIEDGKVWLSLKSGQSVILQTYDTTVDLAKKDVPTVEMAGEVINGNWTLSFTDDSYPSDLKPSYELTSLTAWQNLDQATARAMGTGVYETAVVVDESLLKQANAGMMLSLGDVRESARVYVNGEYAGCAWSAPFEVDVTGKLRVGENRLRIEVTNLPANRIRQMDIDGTEWRIFEDVNILDVVNGNTSQANVRYDNWSLVPSGLNSDVKLVPLRRKSTELVAELVTFTPIGSEYFPCYHLSSPSGKGISSVDVRTVTGDDFSGYTISEDNSLLTIVGTANGYITVSATDVNGVESETCLHANGAYAMQKYVDFTADEAPLCNWQVMANTTAVNGFDVTTAWRRAPEKNSTKEVTLYDGINAQSASAAYYFYYPGYGMAPTTEVELTVDAEKDDVCLLSYLQGSSAKTKYDAADSLVYITMCENSNDNIQLQLHSRSTYSLYRGLQVFRPLYHSSEVSTVRTVAIKPDYYYTLHGQRVENVKRGIYIRGGKKIVKF